MSLHAFWILVARLQHRVAAIDSILHMVTEFGTEVCLIDVDGRYAVLQSRIHTYLRRPSLNDAVMALREADRYIGPDSFFMHLAYYFRIPFLAFFRPTDMYFAPPGMLKQGNYITFSDAAHKDQLRRKLRTFLLPD